MVFYLLVTGVETQPSATASPGVIERFQPQDNECPPPPPPPTPTPTPPTTNSATDVVSGTSQTLPLLEGERQTTGELARAIDVCTVNAIRLFRVSGAGSHSLFEDALPIQRTSALLLVAVPLEVSLAELQKFFGGSLDDIEAIRILHRKICSSSVSECQTPEHNTRQHVLSGNFYSAVILCQTQEGADSLYKANHGRLFHSQPCTSEEAGGPCCYLVFLEMIVYANTLPDSPAGASPIEDIPTAAFELPVCPLCLERLDVSGTGMITHNQGWLSAMAGEDLARAECCSPCAHIARATNKITLPQEISSPSCACCAKREEIWVCLICSHLGCGRYAFGHAKEHAQTHRHRFCLELATGRIWDYSGDVFVHRRLVQTAAACGGLFEVTLPAPAIGDDSSSSAREERKQAWPGHDDILGMELDAILASQLDHQRSLYEARLTELDDQHAKAVQREQARVEQEEATQAQLDAEIADIERKQKALEKQFAAAKKSRGDAEKKLAFLKELNHSLLANRREIQTASKSTADVDARSSGDATSGNIGKNPDPLVTRLRDRVAQLMEAISSMEDK